MNDLYGQIRKDPRLQITEKQFIQFQSLLRLFVDRKLEEMNECFEKVEFELSLFTAVLFKKDLPENEESLEEWISKNKNSFSKNYSKDQANAEIHEVIGEKSFQEALKFPIEEDLKSDFCERLTIIKERCQEKNPLLEEFNRYVDRISREFTSKGEELRAKNEQLTKDKLMFR